MHNYFTSLFWKRAPLLDSHLKTLLPYQEPIYFELKNVNDIPLELRVFKEGPVFSSFFLQYSELLKALKQWCEKQNIQQFFKDDNHERLPAFDLLLKRILFPFYQICLFPSDIEPKFARDNDIILQVKDRQVCLFYKNNNEVQKKILTEKEAEPIAALKQYCFDLTQPKRLDFKKDFSNIFFSRIFYLAHLCNLPTEGYFGPREFIIFNEGKEALERLYVLLQDDKISFCLKERVMLDLQRQFTVCADGILSNVIDAKEDLLAEIGFETFIENIRKTLVQQYAKEHVIRRYGDTKGNERHFVNAYCNYVAVNYGFATKIDDWISRIDMDKKDLPFFEKDLAEKFSPQAVLEMVIDQLDLAFRNILQPIEKFFAKKALCSLNDYKPNSALYSAIETAVGRWNLKYAALYEVNTYSFISIDLEKESLALTPYNPAFLQATVCKNFRNLFLTALSQPAYIQGTNGESITYDHGIIWVTKKEDKDPKANNEIIYIPCTADFLCKFRKVNTFPAFSEKNNVYLLVLNTLCKKVAMNDKILLYTLIKSIWPSLIQIKALKLFGLVLLRLEEIEQIEMMWKNFGLTPQEEQEEIKNTLLWCLASENRLDLLPAKVFSHWVFQKKTLAFKGLLDDLSGTNILWWLAYYKNTPFLEKIFAQKEIVDKDTLEAAPVVGRNAGINVVWLLVNHFNEKFLYDLPAGILTAQHLLTAPKEGLLQSENAVYLLAKTGRNKFLEYLLDKNLIDERHLALNPVDLALHKPTILSYLLGFNRFDLIALLTTLGCFSSSHLDWYSRSGLSDLHLLVNKKQYGIFSELLAQNLISEAHLANSSEGVGENIVFSLIKAQAFTQIEQLLEKKLILPYHLMKCSLEPGDFQGINALWMLVYRERYDLLPSFIQLLNQDELKRCLAQAQAKGEDKGINMLYLLFKKKQYLHIFNFVEQGLIQKEHLFNPLQSDLPEDLGKFFVYDLAFKDQKKLIHIFLKHNLLTKQALSLLGPSGGHALLWLGYYKQFAILQELMEQDLIDAKQLNISFNLKEQGRSQVNKSLLWYIACYKARSLFKKMIEKYHDYLDPSIFSAVASAGYYSGKNVFWFLVEMDAFDLIETLLSYNLLNQTSLIMRTGKTKTGACIVEILDKKEKFELLEKLGVKDAVMSNLPSFKHYLQKLDERKDFGRLLDLVKKGTISQKTLLQLPNVGKHLDLAANCDMIQYFIKPNLKLPFFIQSRTRLKNDRSSSPANNTETVTLNSKRMHARAMESFYSSSSTNLEKEEGDNLQKKIKRNR